MSKNKDKSTKIQEASIHDINYLIPISKPEIVTAANGKKKALITMTVLNDKLNKNGWRVDSKYHSSIARDVIGIAIKVQHAWSDWDIVGTGVSGSTLANSVIATVEVTDAKAIEKFENDTWNEHNMGVSPGLGIEDLVCSICGESVLGEEHEHKMSDVYDGETCYYDVVEPYLKEISFTSDPAYAGTGAGTISEITITASLNKLLEASRKEEVDSMAEDKKTIAEAAETKKKLEAQEAKNKLEAEEKKKLEAEEQAKKEKEEKEKVEAELEAAKQKELNASKKTAEEAHKTLEAQKKELAVINARLGVFVKASRIKVLDEISVTDESLVAEMLAPTMSDETLDAEVKKIKIIQASVEKTNTGSLPSDKTEMTAESNDEVCKAEFGCDTKTLLAEVVGVVDHTLK